jgi:hypothetical protein
MCLCMWSAGVRVCVWPLHRLHSASHLFFFFFILYFSVLLLLFPLFFLPGCVVESDGAASDSVCLHFPPHTRSTHTAIFSAVLYKESENKTKSEKWSTPPSLKEQDQAGKGVWAPVR